MIKLIVSDVDGTFVQDGSSGVNPQAFDAILKLCEKGVQFVITSGKSWVSVEYIFEPVKKKIFYAVNNGVYVGYCGRSLYIYSIKSEIIHRIIGEVCRYPDLEVVYAGANGDCMESPSEELFRWLIESYKFNLTRVDDLLELDEPCVKVSIYKPEGIEAATRDIYEEFKNELKVACTGDVWMDCMVKGVGKGKAIETIQDSLRVRSEEVMTFGDQLNDIEMLGRVYYSFAVVSAREKMRKTTKFQANSNKGDGALKILRHLL